MMKIITIAFAIVALVTSFSFAERGGGKTRGALMSACKGDIDKFCKGVELGEGRLLECMRKHESEMSLECKTETAKARADFKEKRAEIRDACKDDFEKYCKGIRGPLNRYNCLKSQPKISDGCKAVLPQNKI